MAAYGGCEVIAQRLLSAHALPTARDKRGLRPLEVAKRHGHKQLAMLLTLNAKQLPPDGEALQGVLRELAATPDAPVHV
jgi:ankyrin repeat protein